MNPSLENEQAVKEARSYADRALGQIDTLHSWSPGLQRGDGLRLSAYGRRDPGRFRQEKSIMSVIPCHRGGHLCNWPACQQDCDGRPAAEPADLPTKPAVIAPKAGESKETKAQRKTELGLEKEAAKQGGS
jgi:hypothetical protein